jgi:uncharacterized membrane protein
MESRAKFLGHPVHQMLIPIPAGLFIVAAGLDIAGAFTTASWIPVVSFWNIVIGIASALLAAVFGAIDWTKIPAHTRAKKLATIHGIGNVLAVSLFAGSAWIRSAAENRETNTTSLTLEIVAFTILAVTAWLGGELVDRLAIGVDDGAHENAPSSLRTRRLHPHQRP